MSRNQSDHYTYPPTGEDQTRVTSILDGTEGKQRYLVPWSGRVTSESNVDHLDQIAELLKSEGRQAAVDFAKDTAEQERDLKADVGSHVHAMVEQLILWQASPEGRGSDLALPVLPDHLQGQDYDGCPVEDVAEWMIDGFLNFVSEWKPVFRAAEMTVFNYGLGIAGTLDIIADLPDVALAPSGLFVPGPGVRVCIDVKTGRNSGVTWQEQVAAYRQMTECQPDRLATDLHPMPATDCGAVLHLRPEHLDGYRLMPVKPADHAEAWNCFRRAVEIYRSRSARRAKPGKVVYPPRPDGTIPPPRLADLDGEGYGRALVPLVKAGIGDLEQVAAMDAGECLKIKGVAGKLLGAIRVMLADHGLALKGEELLTLTLAVNGTVGREAA